MWSEYLADGDDREAVLAAYAEMRSCRAGASRSRPSPVTGTHSSSSWIPSLRDGLEAIFDEHFERDISAQGDASLRRVVTLADWIAAPLVSGARGRAGRTRACSS